MLHWVLTSYLMRCAFSNRVVHFPAETPINDLESSIDSDYLLTLSDPAQGTYSLEENFDEESVWDFPPHQIDESTLSNLASDEKATVIRLLHYNDDVFVNSYGTIGCCTLQQFKIETTTETPVVIPPYRKSFEERELIKQEIEQMIDAKNYCSFNKSMGGSSCINSQT